VGPSAGRQRAEEAGPLGLVIRRAQRVAEARSGDRKKRFDALEPKSAQEGPVVIEAMALRPILRLCRRERWAAVSCRAGGCHAGR
jgi:hypothetical protein